MQQIAQLRHYGAASTRKAGQACSVNGLCAYPLYVRLRCCLRVGTKRIGLCFKLVKLIWKIRYNPINAQAFQLLGFFDAVNGVGVGV